jgi:hypothetical protein
MDLRMPTHARSTVKAEYQGLHQYLRDRFADTVVLTFAEIEDLLGVPLPEAARRHAEWWTDAGDSVQAQAWIQAHRTAAPNLLASAVKFERV